MFHLKCKVMNKCKYVLIVLACLISVSTFSQKDNKVAEIKIKTSAQCDMCKDRIEKNLSKESGIKSSSLDVKSKVLTVKYDASKTDAAKIKAAVSKIGYDADEVKANTTAYGKLPACCKKN